MLLVSGSGVKDISDWVLVYPGGLALARAVSVVGFKDSGKTRVVEALVGELVGRGFIVGTLKHTAESVLLDTPGKDTWRHREAGSGATAILHGRGSAFFVDRAMTVREAVGMLGDLDFVVTEGFKSLESMAKLIVPRVEGEVEGLSNGLEIGIVDVDGRGVHGDGVVPVITLGDAGGLADVVEERAFPVLPGLDCHGCGFDTCLEFGMALLAGEAELGACVGFGSGFSLRVDGVEVELGPFVQDVTRGVVLGLVSSFKGVGRPGRVELNFEVGEGD
jgi:molybdopterin-guanine dinucleotide biosynthesis protein B